MVPPVGEGTPMQNSVWKLAAMAGVVGVGFLVVLQAQRSITQPEGREAILAAAMGETTPGNPKQPEGATADDAEAGHTQAGASAEGMPAQAEPELANAGQSEPTLAEPELADQAEPFGATPQPVPDTEVPDSFGSGTDSFESSGSAVAELDQFQSQPEPAGQLNAAPAADPRTQQAGFRRDREPAAEPQALPQLAQATPINASAGNGGGPSMGPASFGAGGSFPTPAQQESPSGQPVLQAAAIAESSTEVSQVGFEDETAPATGSPPESDPFGSAGPSFGGPAGGTAQADARDEREFVPFGAEEEPKSQPVETIPEFGDFTTPPAGPSGSATGQQTPPSTGQPEPAVEPAPVRQAPPAVDEFQPFGADPVPQSADPSVVEPQPEPESAFPSGNNFSGGQPEPAGSGLNSPPAFDGPAAFDSTEPTPVPQKSPVDSTDGNPFPATEPEPVPGFDPGSADVPADDSFGTPPPPLESLPGARPESDSFPSSPPADPPSMTFPSPDPSFTDSPSPAPVREAVPATVPERDTRPQPTPDPRTSPEPRGLPEQRRPRPLPNPSRDSFPGEPQSPPRGDAVPNRLSPDDAAPLSPQGDEGLIGEATIDSSAPGGSLKPQLKIEKIAPGNAVLGKPLVYSIVIQNVGTAAAQQVVVSDHIPRGTRLTGTIPQAELDDKQLIWKLGTIEPGAERKISIRVVPFEAGQVGSVATVNFVAEVGARTLITAPDLSLKLHAPEKVTIGKPVRLDFTLSNTGNGDAQSVVLRNIVPEGLQHPGGSDLEYEVGRLPAGASREIALTLTAAKVGPAINSVIVTADGGLSVQEKAEITVKGPDLVIRRRGPKQRYVGRTGTWSNAVTNDSDRLITNATVVEAVPVGMEFVSATQGGQYDPNRRTVTWLIRQMEPGSTHEVGVTLQSRRIGDVQSTVRAIDATGSGSHASSVTTIEGFSALALDVPPLSQPVGVGEQVTLQVAARNRGTAAANDVALSVELPPELKVVDVQGPAKFTQNGNRLTFEPLETVPAGQQAVIKIVTTAQAAAETRVRVQLQNDRLRQPLTHDESLLIIPGAQ